ncbi:unnamed protein product [Rotaria sp. Silwood2]|nr:unnamed protein product [Rotaria sp. Silwood2]CAF4284199.1 unnamed protein product [Rotaria sp. Silwood2]CAF4676129.1 unnamed protein product [Rotaria sp. Silwood2]
MSMIGNLLRVSFSEFEAYLKDSSLLEARLDGALDQEDPNLVDIDKSWDGINFLLTGSIVGDSDHPLEKVLFSMQYIDESQDLGYGPANYVTPDQVKEINEEISKISDEELSKRYDSKKMRELELYPNGWEEPDMLNYLIENFKTVRETYALASNNDQAIITFLS